MRKLNLRNQADSDDKHLITLLKDHTVEEPSKEFIVNVLTKVYTQQAQNNRLHKPLRWPLYLMAAIALLLLVPYFTPLVSTDPNTILFAEFLGTPPAWILTITVGCWMATVVVCIFVVWFSTSREF